MSETRAVRSDAGLSACCHKHPFFKILKTSGVCAFALTMGLATTAFAGEVQSSGLTAGQTTQSADSSQPLEEIQITGSRITRSGFNTPTPVTSVTSDELGQMAPGQLVDSLSELPQFFGNQTPQTIGFPSSGGTNLNLRGAGINRTLVLLDGRRMVPSNRYGTVDVSSFPQALVRSVETVTGGASATYGSDAVAGVVNFILDTDFTGLKGHVEGGETQYGDGQNWEASLAAGTDVGEKGHLLLSVDMYRQKAIDSFDSLRKRSYRKQYARVTNPDPNGPDQIIRPYVEPTNFSNTGVLMFPTENGVPVGPNYEFRSDGSLVPQSFSGVGSQYGGCNCQALDSQNWGVDSDDEISPGVKRASAFAYFDYDLTDNINVYVQGLYGNSSTNQRPSGITLLTSWAPQIFADNAYLPDSYKQLMAERGVDSVTLGFLGLQDPNSPVGDDRTIQTNDTYSGTIGFKANINTGKFFDGWHVNGYYQHGESDQDQHFVNGTRVDKLPLALDAVDDGNGNIVCHAALVNPEQFGDCVPINLFGGVQNISKEAANYITDDDKHNISIVTQDVAELNFDGEVWHGFGAGPVSMALGASYRREHFHQHVQDPDDEYVIINGVNTGYRGLVPYGDPDYPESAWLEGVRPGSVPANYLGDSNSATVQFTSLRTFGGGYNVKEAYTEFDIPLLASVPWAQSLNASLAARYADYSGSGGIWAYKAGLDWQIISDFRLRGTYSRDVRAATLDERFDQTRTGASVLDPATGESVSTAGFNGGNENLDPEKADTITVGAVFQPTFLSGFQASVDWYSIDVKDAIAQLSAQDIVNGCASSGGTGSLCQYVHRNSAGDLTQIDALFLNLSKQKISGIDLEAQYRTDFTLLGGGAESMNWRFYGSWLDENSITMPGTPKDDRAGQIGTGQSLPEYKFTTNVSYNNGPITLFLQERWIDGGILDRTYTESDHKIAGVKTISDNHVSDVWYTDLRLTYNIDTDSGHAWQIYGSVTNLFNQDPPVTAAIVGRGGTNQLNASLYDVLGRGARGPGL